MSLIRLSRFSLLRTLLLTITSLAVETPLLSIFSVFILETPQSRRLLQRNETGAVGGTDTGTTVLDGLVAQRELAQVVANHLSLDFDLQKHRKCPVNISLSFALQTIKASFDSINL